MSEAGTGSTRGTMINCASCVAGVVLAANEAKVASELSPSVLLVRMQGLVSSNSDVVVGELLEKGSAVNGKDLEEACKQFALLVIGCIGASFDVSLLSIGSSSGTAVCSLLYDLAFQQLDSSSEQIRVAASYCIGNLSVGNSTSCLPLLISAITANSVNLKIIYDFFSNSYCDRCSMSHLETIKLKFNCVLSAYYYRPLKL